MLTSRVVRISRRTRRLTNFDQTCRVYLHPLRRRYPCDNINPATSLKLLIGCCVQRTHPDDRLVQRGEALVASAIDS